MNLSTVAEKRVMDVEEAPSYSYRNLQWRCPTSLILKWHLRTNQIGSYMTMVTPWTIILVFREPMYSFSILSDYVVRIHPADFSVLSFQSCWMHHIELLPYTGPLLRCCGFSRPPLMFDRFWPTFSFFTSVVSRERFLVSTFSMSTLPEMNSRC